MYQYFFDKDTTQKIEDSTNSSKNLFEKFGDVDNKYNTLTKSDVNLNLQKMEYSEPSQEDITNRAKNKLEDYKNSTINSIEENYVSKLNQINNSQKQIGEDAKKNMTAIEQKYDNVKEDAKNDAIKRGLARSSIVVNTLNKIDMQKMNSLTELQQQTTQKIEELNATKNSLENQKQNALNSFDIAYAVKLQDEINSINDEIEKNKQTVIKYNNEVENLNAKWEKERQEEEYKKITELAKLASQYGVSVFDVLKQNEKYAIAREYFANMSKEDAIAELGNNANYKTALGKTNYNKLLEEINNK